MIKRKRVKNNKCFYTLVFTNIIVIAVFLLLIYFYKNVSFLILMLTCLSITNSYNYLEYYKNYKNERLKITAKLTELIKNNNYIFDKDLKIDLLNKELAEFNETTFNNKAIKPYEELFIKIESRNIKEIILNSYILNNSKTKKEDIINRNMILINTIYTNEKEENGSVILFSYMVLLMTIMIFIMKVIIW